MSHYTYVLSEVVNSSERWLIHAEWWLLPTSVGRTLRIHVHVCTIAHSVFYLNRPLPNSL